MRVVETFIVINIGFYDAK